MTRSIYQALDRRIRETPYVKIVDWYMEQYSGGDDNLVLNTPAVFLEFAPVDWVSGASGRELWTEMRLTVHIVTESAYEDKQRFIITDHFDVQESILEALHMWECNVQYITDNTEDTEMLINTMTLESSSSEHQLSEFVVTKLIFSAIVYNRNIQLQIEKQTSTVTTAVQVVINKVENLSE